MNLCVRPHSASALEPTDRRCKHRGVDVELRLRWQCLLALNRQASIVFLKEFLFFIVFIY